MKMVSQPLFIDLGIYTRERLTGDHTYIHVFMNENVFVVWFNANFSFVNSTAIMTYGAIHVTEIIMISVFVEQWST